MLPKRTQYIDWIQEANGSGARLTLACIEVGISVRTYRRWYKAGQVSGDKRCDAVRQAPRNKLTPTEQAAIIAVCNQPRFASLPPTQIVPTLLDEGGSYAQQKIRLIDEHKHLILTAVHPSPLSAYRGFFGCKHFSKTNTYLSDKGLGPIDWR